MSKLPKYPAYKPSGAEWLGEIPEHWEIVRLKNIIRSKITDGPHETPVFQEFGIPFLSVDGIQNGELVFEKCRYVSLIDHDKYQKKCKIEKYDILMGKAASIGKIAQSKVEFEYSIWSPLALIKPLLAKVNPTFLEYYLKSTYSQFQIEILCTSNTQKNISMDDIPKIISPLPPLIEQESISSFLDRKNAQIDQAIAQKERIKDLLKERRQILIFNAVIRGIVPNVKMKDSGLDWIGAIPEHWVVVSNRVLFDERNEPGNEDLPILSVSIHTAVSSEEISDDENIRGKVRIEDKRSYKLVKVNDIAFNMMRAWQGAIGAVRVIGMVSPAYVVAKPIGPINADFFEYQYRTSSFIQQMDRNSKGITDFRKRLYWNEFKQLKTILPPIQEQEEIVFYIQTIEQKIATAISYKEKEIEKLKEYKATLINSTVTGQIKVK